MDSNIILTELTNIFIQIFEDKRLKISATTSPSDISAWDSLNHVLLISAIEKHFNIRFGLEDMLGFQKVADIVEGIRRKIA
jgi:acyl carrier protein